MVGITKSMVAPTPDRNKTYNNDIYVTELNGDGVIRSEVTMGGINADWANAVAVAEDGALMVLGHTDASITGSLDVCLLKITGR